MFLRPVFGMLAFLAFLLTGPDARAQTRVSISKGDWVGELRLGTSSTFKGRSGFVDPATHALKRAETL